MLPPRVNVIVGVSRDEVDMMRKLCPQYRDYVAVTPHTRKPIEGRLGGYVWTPSAQMLPARVRLQIRGMLKPLLDEYSTEEKFPETLFSW